MSCQKREWKRTIENYGLTSDLPLNDLNANELQVNQGSLFDLQRVRSLMLSEQVNGSYSTK